MKKLLSTIFVLCLAWNESLFAGHSVKHKQEQMEERLEKINDKNLLKRNAECQDVLESKNKWNFLFSLKDVESYYVDIEGSYPTNRDDGYGSDIFQKNFAVKTDSKLFWYQLLKNKNDDDWNSLLVNALDYLPADSYPVHYMSIIVFFNSDYKKTEYKKLEDLYLKAINEGKINFGTNIHLKYQKDFFNEAHNFLKTRLVLGKESRDKGNWEYVLRAECKAFPSEKKPNLKEAQDAIKEMIKKKTN